MEDWESVESEDPVHCGTLTSPVVQVTIGDQESVSEKKGVPSVPSVTSTPSDQNEQTEKQEQLVDKPLLLEIAEEKRPNSFNEPNADAVVAKESHTSKADELLQLLIQEAKLRVEQAEYDKEASRLRMINEGKSRKLCHMNRLLLGYHTFRAMRDIDFYLE
jgi:hypothetical protein